MAKKIYVGNIPFNSTEEGLREHFSACGEVESVNIIMDRATGKPRGFCFVTMDSADKAIRELDNVEFQGRSLRVKEAIEKNDRPRR